jgi:hypothetical protein
MVFFCGFFLIALIDGIFKNDFEKYTEQILYGFFGTLLFGLITFYQIKTRLLSVQFSNNKIETIDFLKKHNIKTFKEINGFEKRIVKGKFEDFEYLHLLSNNKNVAVISQTYHKNYSELKIYVEENFKYLGISNYGLLSEIKAILTLNYL